MQKRVLGNSGIETSVVGFGAWAIGGWMWGGTETSDALDAVAAAIDSGIDLIDTAPMYGFGRSEEIVGKAIRGKRDRVVLATKCGLHWSQEKWEEGKGDLHFFSDEKGATSEYKKYYVYKYLRPEAIAEELEASLERLQTDYIDLYQTHWQESTTPIEDTMAMLLKLKDQGKIRAIGVSNASIDQIRRYEKTGPVDVDQERFSLLDRKLEEEGYFEHCAKQGISILAYSPLVNGLLTGKMDPQRRFGEGDLRASNPRFSAENIEAANAMLEKFRPIAETHQATLAQLIIAWTFAKYEKMHVLCGGRKATQVTENATAGEIALSSDEVESMDQIAREANVK
jgi:aryl-alcohol dehydrogenase-like predicted oxidoreductase